MQPTRLLLCALLLLALHPGCGDDTGDDPEPDAFVAPVDAASRPDAATDACPACGGECVDVATDVEHCGACDRACPSVAGGEVFCEGGVCGFECAEGFADCDGDSSNGCEVVLSTDPNHCGACNTECTAGPMASATCTEGTCGFECDEGFGACGDLPTAEGCPTPLETTIEHCGACGNECEAGPFATAATCMDGACGNTCETGRADCDGDVVNGCEADLSNEATCGACGTMCDTLSFCDEGTCVRRPVAFVTSTLTRPDTLGSLEAGDAICAARASAAGLPGTFLAWLSDDTGSPVSRFRRSATGYVRTDGVVLANDWADLVDGALDAALDRDEFGVEVTPESGGSGTCALTHVATGTMSNGLPVVGWDCDGWNGIGTGVGGETSTTGSRWTQGCGGSRICTTPMRFYCFEQ